MLKTALKIIAAAVVVGLIVIQFFGIDQTNPPISERETLEATMDVPADVSQILSRSCNDCHSNKTVYPWYSRVQPFGWFLADHIRDGRRHLNFSEFSAYDDNKKGKLFEEICEEVNKGHMPLPSYLWIHRDAALTDSQRRVLCDWSNAAATRFGR